jgi:hypothetical protein
VDPVGHSAQLLRWRANISFKAESCLSFLSNSVSTATQIPSVVLVAGKTTACTTFKTMVASVLSPTILIELQMACAGLTGEAPSKSPLSLT